MGRLPSARIRSRHAGANLGAWLWMRGGAARRWLAPRVLPLAISVSITASLFLALTWLSIGSRQLRVDAHTQRRFEAWVRLAPGHAAPVVAPAAATASATP